MNSSKRKGDVGEREAFRVLTGLLPDHAYPPGDPRAGRELGAGRAADRGDLSVLPDVAVQVKAWKASALGQAVRQAAAGAARQAVNRSVPLAVGMSLVERARADSVRWIASTLPGDWPVEPAQKATFATIGKALAWLRDDTGPAGYRPWPRTERVCLLADSSGRVLLAPIEAWAADYRAGHAHGNSQEQPDRKGQQACDGCTSWDAP